MENVVCTLMISCMKISPFFFHLYEKILSVESLCYS